MAPIILSGCIETFDVSYDLDTDAIVVTGIITDIDPAHVEITRPASSPNTKEANVQRVSGATIILMDDEGNKEYLTETKSGYYKGINKGVVGRSYSITIELPEGDTIVSVPQLLKPCASIDTIQVQQINHYLQLSSSVQVKLNGLDIYVHINQKDTFSHFYKWKTVQTYKMYSAFDFYHDEPPCYVTLFNRPTFVVGESISQTSDIFSKKLKYLSPNSTFRYGQSFEVKQYSLTDQAYDYWKKIDEQKNNVGSIAS